MGQKFKPTKRQLTHSGILWVTLFAISLQAFAIPKTTSPHPQEPPEPARAASEISSRSDFDRLARTFYGGRFDALPHVMFVIDRANSNKVYYVNSKLFRFHKDFVNATYLSLERGQVFYENNYLKSNRRFILGTIAYQQNATKFTYEFWEGDRLTAALLTEADAALHRTFYEKLFFKPNSADQASIVAPAIAVLSASDLARDSPYQALNIGESIGQLRILDQITDDTVIDRNQIVIFKEVPVHLPPLSGIITTEPASALSHINMLAKSWAIPNAYIKNADNLYRSLEGKYVKLEVRDGVYHLGPAPLADVQKRQEQWIKRADAITPRAELAYRSLTDLGRQRAVDSNRFGAKSANLGELIHARIPGFQVPPGFTIPFFYYQQFVQQNGLEQKISSAVEEDRFVHDPVYRKARLKEIRGWLQSGQMDRALSRAVLSRAHREYPGKGLFARSSTNAEDLPAFSGAGLYTTVPNAKTDDQLIDAIKTVWASIWNYEAYEARESFGMNHFAVYMAVLIQVGINADGAGVAITTDPFNSPGAAVSLSQPGGDVDTGGPGPTAVYINAKRGLGMKVVEGQKIAEQVIYRPGADTIQVLTRSVEDTMLTFDRAGGIKEVRIDPDRKVLTDEMVRRLARAAIRIKHIFNEKDQDIEWVFSEAALFIVQSRPYIKHD